MDFLQVEHFTGWPLRILIEVETTYQEYARVFVIQGVLMRYQNVAKIS